MKKTYLRLAGFAFLFSSLVFDASAQLSGVYTINSGQPTGGTNYINFTDFANAINTNGVSGPVTVNVVANSGPYVEQIIFNQISGASASNPITINGNGNLLTFNSANAAQRHVMALNGTDYLRVNNLNFEGTGTQAYVAYLYSGADFNTFTACSFSVPLQSTSTNQIPVVISGSGTSYATASNSGNNNKFMNCTMSGGYAGVWIYGLTAAPFNGANEIVNCSINDFFYCGIYSYYGRDNRFIDNTIQRLQKTASTTTYGVFLIYNSGVLVDGNRVQRLFDAMLTNTSTFYGLFGYFNPTSNPNIVRNNIISANRHNGPAHGLYYYYPGGTMEHNTISLDDATSTSNSTNYGVYTYGNAQYPSNVVDNIISITRGGGGAKYGIYIALAGFTTTDYNDIYVATPAGINYVGYFNANITSLAQFQSSGFEMNGTVANPMFTNLANNNMYPTNPAINNLGSPGNVIFDADKNVRNTSTPDMGALEFLTPACSGAPGSNSVSAPSYSICPGEDVQLGLVQLNANSGFTYQWQVSTVSNVGPFTNVAGATSLFYVAPSVTANTWYSVVMTCTNPGGGSISPVGQIMVSGPTSGTVPYYEGFEGIGLPNRLPNCSWLATSIGGANRTYTSSQSGNRVPRTGTSYASFSNGSPGTSAYYTNPIAMSPGITYSAALHYATEYFGHSNWTNLSILVGPNQNTTGLVQVASISPAISGPYKLLDGLFTVPSAGNYYVCFRATSTSGSAEFLSIDDISVTIPCYEGGPNTPTVTANASSTLVCAGDAVNLTAAGAATYNWSSGATGAATVEFPTQSTLYSVIGTDPVTGCGGMASIQVDVNPAPSVIVIANPPTVCAGQSAVLTALSPGSNFSWSNSQNGQNITVSPATATSYTVIATNALGCTGQYVQNVGVNPAPVISVVSSNSGEACKDDMLTLSASGGVSYQWVSNVDPNVYQGSSINVKVPSSSIFTITSVGTNGCVGKTTLNQNISECTSIKDAGSLSGLQVFPNPTSGALTIVFGNNADHSYTVTDVTGRVIMSNANNNVEVSLDLSSFASGIYYVKLQSDNASEVVKVVKQ